MLFHHDARGYEAAASDAAKHARGIMEKKIADGRASAGALLELIMTQVPADAIVRSTALSFQAAGTSGVEGDAPRVEIGFGGESRRIHKHALGQIAGKAGVPGAYLAELVSGPDWQRALAANVLNEHFHKGQKDARFLARSVDGDVRGFLSDRYRRLDSRPLVEAFASACQSVGAVPVDGTASDTRVTLKAFLPVVFEPVPNEVMCLGLEWGNSDFGAARHTVRAMIWRLWCTNKATMEDSLAQVHLGRQLGEDIEFSKKTYEYDTKASVSALGDVVKGVLGPAKVNALLEGIRRADEKKIDWKDVKTSVARRLLKGELKAVEDAFGSEDVVNLPAGKSVWRASNAISWIAGRTEDPDRKLELERVAGEILNGRADKKEVDEAA
jgi:hypothetical protein